MTLEDQIQNCGIPLKKPRLKIPKRGPGVAQLEKLRLQQQQKKNKATALPAISPSSSQHPVQSFHRSSFPSNSFHSGSPFQSNTVIVPGDGIVPEYWSCHANDSDDKGFVLKPVWLLVPRLTHESNSNPINSLVRRTQPRHQPPSSSMVNDSSSGDLSTPSLAYSMEPPSNQSYNGGYLIPLQVQPQKMIGVKRPYLSLGVPSSSTSNSKRSNTVNENFYRHSPTPAPPSGSKSPPTFPCYQGIREDQINQSQQPFHRPFRAVAKAVQIRKTSSRIQNGNEVGESIDLSLKL